MKIGSLPVIVQQPPVTQTDISVAVLAKSLDTIEQAGQSMIKMMEQSVNVHLGNSIDIRI